jgi:hypothetical protein
MQNRNPNRRKKAPSKKHHFRKKSKTSLKRKKSFFGREQFMNLYFALYEEFLNARRKYFELYGKGRAGRKVYDAYYRSLAKLRKFEEELNPDQMKIFNKYFPKLKQEIAYSQNRQIPDQGTMSMTQEQIIDPHLLPSQKSEDYSLDTEESTGTMEDYKLYKGI